MMRLFSVLVVTGMAWASGKECHPENQSQPKPGDLFNCHRECDTHTEWCMPSKGSSTGWACGPAHKRGEAQPGASCVPGGDPVFCSNCIDGYFCQNDTKGYQCDVMMPTAPVGVPQLIHSPVAPAGPENALCSPCVQLGGQSISILLNYILNVGVVGGCSKLCGHLTSKGSREACDLVCGVVGIKAFTKALNHTDLDPIYFCEILDACPAGRDDAALQILSVVAQPTSIAKGDTVELSVQVNVTNASGVGEFGLAVHGPVTSPVSQTFLLAKGIPVGQQTLAVKLTVQDDNSGNPPVVWNPGSYQFTFEVCQGECHSKHPHSKYFGSKAGNFTLKDNLLIAI